MTGFAEGAGCFTYSRSGRNLGLYFAIKLAKKDRRILEEIREFFGGVGSVYDVAARPGKSSSGGSTRAADYYRVTRLGELERIVEHFDRYPLRGAKGAAYRLWREMFRHKLANPRGGSAPALEDLARRLSAASLRNQGSGGA